jgi:hypothetical protein
MFENLVEAPPPANVVLGSGSYERRPFTVSIQIDFDLSFPPPFVRIHFTIGLDTKARP